MQVLELENDYLAGQDVKDVKDGGLKVGSFRQSKVFDEIDQK